MDKKATPRQLWALYCITKKDYRNEDLSFDDASKLIKELGNPDYQKTKKTSLEDEFIAFYKTNILPSVVASIKESLGIMSVVEDDESVLGKTDGKKYLLPGFGCSISYLKYDKRSKKAAEIETIFRKLRFTTFKDLVLKEFDNKLIKEYESMGCPLGAVYCQDYNINSTLFAGVVCFAHEQGVKNIDYITRLD